MQPLDAERVREWRGRRMLSQQEVADRAGTSLFTIQRIERGEGNVRPKTGRGVATALGVPIEELLPKAQAPLFPELPEQEPADERREHAEQLLAAVQSEGLEAILQDPIVEERLLTLAGLVERYCVERSLEWGGAEHERRAVVTPWAAYTRQVAGRIRDHSDDPDSPAFRDPWAALFFVEEANRNAADLSRFVDEQLSVALEIADVEAMHELMAAFEELGRAIDTASERARSMEAGRSSSELGEARRRAEEAAAERESAAAGLSVHSEHSA